MEINKSLNLVISVEREDETLYVHAMPIAYEVFQKYYLVLGKTFASLGQQGLTSIAGPRVTMMLMEDIAKSTARAGVENVSSWWEGPDGIEKGLKAEMVRLSNILTPTPQKGWAVGPLDQALKSGFLSAEEAGDVLNQLGFFTACSAAPRADRALLVRQSARLFNGSTTSLNCTDYAASLTISTQDESSGEKEAAAQALSPPPSTGSPVRAGRAGRRPLVGE
jgi:hypothetical protein